MVEFYDKYDYTEEEIVKEVITDEEHTIPSSSPYIIHLRHIPKKDSVSINSYTEVFTSPSSEQYRVFYGAEGLGQVEFNPTQSGNNVEVNYQAVGSVVWAETYGNAREGVNKLQDEVKTARSTYIHKQQVSSDEWLIKHDLEKYPSVSIVDTDEPPRKVIGDVIYVNKNEVKLKFDTSFSGKAYLN